MTSFSNTFKSLAFCSIFTPFVAGHGYVKEVVIDGKQYPGFLNDVPSGNDPSKVVGWSMVNPANVPSAHGSTGLVDFASVNMICGNNSSPAQTSAPVTAGATVSTTWGSGDPNSQWPHSQGIILNYLAPCPNNNCAAVSSPDQLEFFKIAELRGQPPTNWAMSAIHANGQTSVVIPSTIPSGAYVLRQELINLDLQWADEDWTASAVTDPSLETKHAYYGPQIYPACINLQVSNNQGGGSVPSGTKGNALYKNTDPSFTMNTYNQNEVVGYPMPGPSVIPGGCSDVSSSGQGCSSSSSSAGGGPSSGSPQPTGSPGMRFATRRRGRGEY